MTLNEAQKRVDDWIQTIGVRYFSELTNTVVLMEEVGEFARIVARKYGEQTAKTNEDISDEKLADELADILWVVICLANQTGVNLDQALEMNFQKKTDRDSDRHKKNPKL